MKIQFRKILNTHHILGAFILICGIFAIICFNLHLQSLLGESQESILHSRRLSVTHISTFFYCDLLHDDCLYPIVSNKSDISRKYITNVQLVGSHILPLISLWLQICLVREFFSLTADHHRVIIYALWFASIFLFIGMATNIYWSSCYHVYTTLTLYLIGASLWFFGLHNVLVNVDPMSSSFNRNQVIIAHR